MDDNTKTANPDDDNIKRIKQMNRVVCICNGIKLATVLRALEGSDTVADVNRKAGTGSGGCKGERCGPRIKTLLKKKLELENPSNKNED